MLPCTVAHSVGYRVGLVLSAYKLTIALGFAKLSDARVPYHWHRRRVLPQKPSRGRITPFDLRRLSRLGLHLSDLWEPLDVITKLGLDAVSFAAYSLQRKKHGESKQHCVAVDVWPGSQRAAIKQQSLLIISHAALQAFEGRRNYAGTAAEKHFCVTRNIWCPIWDRLVGWLGEVPTLP